jgi:DNA-binding response OmpR family regulator
MENGMRVLVVEDDADIAGNIGDFLAGRDAIVDFAYDGDDGLRQARRGGYDVILLDVNLPGVSGFDLCRQLRADASVQTPVIFTTARGEITDKLEGFEAGGWDYLVKPFSLAELGARIQALALRQSPQQALAAGALSFNPARRRLTVKGRTVHLPNIAFRLLTALMRAYPDAISREQLVTDIWGEEEPDSSPLRSHVSDLRARLATLRAGVELQVVRGFGYALSERDPGPDGVENLEIRDA